MSRQVYYYLGGLFDFVIFVKLRVQPVTGRDRRGFILFRCQLVVKMPNLVFQSEGQMPARKTVFQLFLFYYFFLRIWDRENLFPIAKKQKIIYIKQEGERSVPKNVLDHE